MPKDAPRDPSAASTSFDYRGTALFATAMFFLLLGLTEIASHPDDLGNPLPWLAIVVSAALVVLFIRQELHAPEPIIDLTLLRWRPFLAANMQIFMGSASFNGFFNFMPYYATLAYGMTATQAGAFLTPRSLTAILVSLAGSFLIVLLGYRRPWLVGNFILGAAILITSLELTDVSLFGVAIPNFWLLAALMCMAGFGIGLSGPPSNNAALDLIPERIAAIAGLRAMFANSGAVLGTTIVTLVLSRFDDKTEGLHYIFIALGCMVLSAIVWIFMVPDTAWQRRKERLAARAAGLDTAAASTASSGASSSPSSSASEF
jgi:MFS family permease